MSSSNRLIVSILLVAALAVAFWMLALGPKRRKKPTSSPGRLNQLHASVAESSAAARSGRGATRIPGRLPTTRGPRTGGPAGTKHPRYWSS